MTAPRRWSSVAREAAIVVFFAACACAWWWPLPLHVADGQMENPMIDSGFNQWILGWGAHILPRDPLAFFDANMYHPRPDVLAWGDHLFFLDLFAVPLVPIVGLVATYNLLVLGTMALSGYTASLWLRASNVALPVALAAGVIWLSSYERWVEYSHIQIAATWTVPLVFLCFDRAVARGGRWWFAGLGAAAWSTFATNVYLGLFTAITFGVYAAVAWVVRKPDWRRMGGAGLAWIGAAIAALPLYLPSLRYQRAEGVERSIDEQVGTTLRELMPWPPVGDLARHIAIALDRPIGYRGHHAPDLATWALLAVLAVAAIVLRRRYRAGALSIPAIAAGAVALIASLGPRIAWREAELVANPVFHALYAVVPGFRALRVPQRWLLFAGLLLGAAGAAALSRVLENRHAALRWVVAAMFAVVAFVEQAPVRVAMFESPQVADYPSLVWLAEQPGDIAVLEYPISAALASATTQALEARRMFLSTHHWKRRVGGAVSPVIAKQYELDAYLLQSLGADPAALALLEEWDVSYVLVYPADLARYPEFGPSEQVIARLDATDGLRRVEEFPDAIVYEVVRTRASTR